MDNLKYKVILSTLKNKIVSGDNTIKFNDIDKEDIEKSENYYTVYNTVYNSTLSFVFGDDFINDIEILKNAVKCINTNLACIVCFHFSELGKTDDFFELIEKRHLSRLPIALVVYDNDANINIQKQFVMPGNIAKRRTEHEFKSYWCWWRDISQYEIVLLLKLSQKYDNYSGDIYGDKVYPEFFEMMINKETKQWNGKCRNKKYSEASYKSEKQNYKIPLCQLGLLTRDIGRITDKGKYFINIAEQYGDNSVTFLNLLSKTILLDGEHLNLIKDLDEFQTSYPELIPATSSEFFVLFDKFLIDKNSVGTRKPTAIKTGAKKSYVRDEPKLWNKLGLVLSSGKLRYYKPFKGVVINWQKINEILLSIVDGGESDEEI